MTMRHSADGSGPGRLTRRTVLRAAAAGALGAALTARAPAGALGAALPLSARTAPAPPADAAEGWKADVAAYLETLRRADGGYAWPGQDRSHLAVTHAAVGALRTLGRTPPDRDALVAFVRTHHPRDLKKLEQEHRIFTFQQVRTLAWLGADLGPDLAGEVRSWRQPVAYMKAYEKHGYPVFRSEAAALACRPLAGLAPGDAPDALLAYLDSRRRPDGTYNNTPASDGSGGHVTNTWWGLEAERAVGRPPGARQATVAWLRACQRPGGGFTYEPDPKIGALDDVAYTWAAVLSLARLRAAPADAPACTRYLRSLHTADGGFADRPGWSANPVATYYAVEALAALAINTDGEQSVAPAAPAAAPRTEAPEGLRVFSIQIEAHGQGSPAEAVDLARALRIHLWGAKNAEPAWLRRAQALADADGTGVRFFSANEDHGTWIDVPGQGTYSHMDDYMMPAGADAGAPVARGADADWETFRAKRFAPLEKAGGRLVWQFGENEPLVRMVLDDALVRGGYAAVSTFHFGNPDFTNTEPFLERYRGQLPMVALQDAHGREPWWFADMTEGFRTLFLAREPTWEAWLEALAAKRVAAVRHDATSGGATWMHAPSDAVAEAVRRLEDQWRWWDNPDIRRPMVSVVAVRPGDAFEAGRPERGVTVRVRPAWTNTAQGLPKSPLAELVRLTVDGRQVTPALEAPRAGRGKGVSDYYHWHHVPEPTPGRHTATAVVRRLDTRQEVSRTVVFET